VKFGRVVFEICERTARGKDINRQTNRHTGTLIVTLWRAEQ